MIRFRSRSRTTSVLLTAVVTLAAALALAPTAAAAPDRTTPWGTADGDRHPASGQLVRFLDGEALGGCSGTLVSPTVFVTAGHCSIRKQQAGDSLDLWVTFAPEWSKDDLSFPRYRVAYAATAADIDLGVEVLDRPVVGITPATLPTAGLLDGLVRPGSHATTDFVGYGQGRPGEKDLQGWRTSLRLTSTPTVVRASETILQTWADLPNPTWGCSGNSGGGTYLPGTSVVVASASYGDTACAAHGGSVRLDSAAARDFLGDFVALP